MKFFHPLLSLILLVSLYACKSKDDSSSFPLDNARKLKVTNIFRKDSVLAFTAAVGDTNKALAGEYVQKAQALLNNDFKKSTYYFKRALTLFPDPSVYLIYGDALNGKEKYEEAQIAYDMLVEINPAQTGAQYIKMIKNNLLYSGEYYGAYSLLDNFRRQNYNMDVLITEVLGDEKIKSAIPPMKIRGFTTYVHNIWGMPPPENTGSENGASFEDYLKQFDPVVLPFSVGKKDLQRFTYEHSFEGEFDDYDASTDFSRFQESELLRTKYYTKTDFQYFVKEANGLIVLIHAADSSAEAVPADFRCIYHRLLVYNSEGTLLDSRIIGVHAGEKLITYKIGEDLTIYAEEFSRNWKKPFVRYEIDNEILTTAKMGEYQYKVTDKGEIVELPLTQ